MAKAGGGIHSNKLVKPGVRYGNRAQEMRPAGLAQIGSNRGNRATNQTGKLSDQERLTGATKPAGGPGGVPLGNEVAGNVGAGGPGAGREVHRTGSQAQHGPVEGRPAAQGRDILSQFGPESMP